MNPDLLVSWISSVAMGFSMFMMTRLIFLDRRRKLRDRATEDGREFHAQCVRLFEDIHIEICLSGSRMTCDPPVMNTDIDAFVYTPEDNKSFVAVTLFEQGWVATEKDRKYQEDTDKFMSWRDGDRNLIVTHDHKFFLNTCAATALCRELNLKKKAHRIAVFRAMRA